MIVTALLLLAGGPVGQALGADQRPAIVLEVRDDGVYHRGDDAQVRVTVDRNAHVMVMRVNTDGRVSMLFPATPFASQMLVGGAHDLLDPTHPTRSISIDDYPGVGQLFAFASTDAFDLTAIATDGAFDVARAFDRSRLVGDPEVAITEFAAGALPDSALFSYDEMRYVVAPTPPPVIAVPCIDCDGQLFPADAVPIHEWCGTFHPHVHGDPIDVLDVLLPPPPPAPAGLTPSSGPSGWASPTTTPPSVRDPVDPARRPSARRPRENQATGRDVRGGRTGSITAPRRPASERGRR